jgi:hypothetical protein
MTRLLNVFLVGSITLFAAAPTFHKDVLPILQRHCQGCHRPGEIGPMPLLTYSQVRPFAAAIRETVRLKKMPPWGADPAHGKFSNDPALTPSEIATLTQWADQRAPEGDLKGAPEPLEFVEGWNIGVPERVFEMPQPYTVPATGTIDYTYFVVSTGFKEDRWIQDAEVRPANRGVVHHVIVYIRQPGSTWLKDAKPGEPFVPVKRPEGLNRASSQGEYLAGYTPGKSAMRLSAGQGKLLKAGSDLVFQMHYTTNGKEGVDRTRLGINFAKTVPSERILTVAVANRDFAIPPGAPSHPVTSDLTFVGNARIVAYWPHMHVRGKSFRFEGVTASGQRQVLLNVPRFDFNWQHRYLPEQPFLASAGSKLECFATFDNSPNNAVNPDPKASVRWGDQTWEEMMIGFIEIAFDAAKSTVEIFRRPMSPVAVSSAAN